MHFQPQTDTDTKAGLDENYGGRKFATLVLGIDIEDEPYDDERSVFLEEMYSRHRIIHLRQKPSPVQFMGAPRSFKRAYI